MQGIRAVVIDKDNAPKVDFYNQSMCLIYSFPFLFTWIKQYSPLYLWQIADIFGDAYTFSGILHLSQMSQLRNSTLFSNILTILQRSFKFQTEKIYQGKTNYYLTCHRFGLFFLSLSFGLDANKMIDFPTFCVPRWGGKYE